MTPLDGPPDVRVREAAVEDCEEIAVMVRALAAHVGHEGSATATAADFERALFGRDARVGCLVAEVPSPSGAVVAGMAMWFTTFSTWQGRHGAWLEDLFVHPGHRGLGIGRTLVQTLAGVCAERGWGRLEWLVLDSNTSAQAFYRRLGAQRQEGASVWRLAGEDLPAVSGTMTEANRG
ncbi:GNAT family N-acetyltransferase [Kineococcus glutinatus]|uniref:GNAT family N-acetyltransferase n=1 Tax=Kineococcus glutinatus TaxID=1070872 RepID=A0ABP9HBC5_9ACTN